MAQDWAVAAGCEVAGAALVASTGNKEIYTFTCGAPPTRFVKVRCARYRHSAPIRPTPWCVAAVDRDGHQVFQAERRQIARRRFGPGGIRGVA